ncbi:unnamed protein product [Somion occarium]|uniref:FAD/NAD(P)-binding domain-containing protein n=1 Tax=Somion occarium TaxID=3059160 RepID=A0ABP1CZA7_9APHY
MSDLPNPLVDSQTTAPLENNPDGKTGVTDNVDSPVKDICIIGGGPSGLAALRILHDHPLYKAGRWRAVAYEAREDLGGIWLPAPADTADPPFTPLYDSLTTNIVHPTMGYPGFPFPPSTPLHPPASTVLKYLRDYAAHFNLYPHLQFNTLVQSVKWDKSRKKWQVTVRKTKIAPGLSGEYADETLYYDLVVVANGHYRLPRYPSTPGLKAWLDSGHATHSVYYRNTSHPSITNARTILVVGAGPSGLDISSDLRTGTSKNVVHSFSGAKNEDLDGGRFKTRPRVKEFLSFDAAKGEGTVLFEDGTTESGISYCILATGYQDSFPFLEPPSSDSPPVEVGIPPAVPPLPPKLYNSTYHLFPLAKHIWPLVRPDSFPPSSLAFLGLPFRVIPFPLVEAQSRAIFKVFEDPSSLDVAREAVEIVSRYEEISKSLPPSDLYPREIAIAQLWHFLDEEQFDYCDALHEFVGGEYAKPEWKVPGWVKEFYEKKFVIRQVWRELVKRGVADDWVRGVGEGKSGKDGMTEWVDLMRKMLKWAEDEKLVIEAGSWGSPKTRL